MTDSSPTPDVMVMGVLNITPDSFSDGGLYDQHKTASEHGRKLYEAGAHIIDIGGESTAPGSQRISAETEINRILPTIRALAPETTISVDTYHAETARSALEAGACIINDVSGLRAEPQIADVIAEHDASLIIMHSKETGHRPHASDQKVHYDDLVHDIGDFLERQSECALAAGIPRDHIWLDPGWGRFVSVNPDVSFELLARFGELAARFPEQPMVVAASRKGFLGTTNDHRDAISQYVGMMAIDAGAGVIRTHDVAMAHAFLKTREAVAAFRKN